MFQWDIVPLRHPVTVGAPVTVGHPVTMGHPLWWDILLQ